MYTLKASGNGDHPPLDSGYESFEDADRAAQYVMELGVDNKLTITDHAGNVIVTYEKDLRSGLYQKGF